MGFMRGNARLSLKLTELVSLICIALYRKRERMKTSVYSKQHWGNPPQSLQFPQMGLLLRRGRKGEEGEGRGDGREAVRPLS